jgi:phage shock protein E
MSAKLSIMALFCLALGSLSAQELQQQQQAPRSPKQVAAATTAEANPNINMEEHLKMAREAAEHRQQRRISEEEFIKLSKEQGVVVLDARSKQRYDELHIDGAMNLSFPDITVESLAKHFPDKNTKILIYCNNNFKNNPPAFPTKSMAVALNLSTFITLYTYGYKNVYELGPLLDLETTKLKLVGTSKQ